MDEEKIPISALVTRLGHFHWKYMPFGLGNERATFQMIATENGLGHGCLLSHLPLRHYHYGLRGSASRVLTATGFVNGRWTLSTPHILHTP